MRTLLVSSKTCWESSSACEIMSERDVEEFADNSFAISFSFAVEISFASFSMF